MKLYEIEELLEEMNGRSYKLYKTLRRIIIEYDQGYGIITRCREIITQIL